MFSFWSSPKYNSLRGRKSTDQSLWTSGPSCGTAGSCVPLGRAQGYAVLLLEQGVLCVLPILWAALLFSEAGWDFWVCCVPAVSPRRRAGERVERKGGGGNTDVNDREAGVGKRMKNHLGKSYNSHSCKMLKSHCSSVVWHLNICPV